MRRAICVKDRITMNNLSGTFEERNNNNNRKETIFIEIIVSKALRPYEKQYKFDICDPLST